MRLPQRFQYETNGHIYYGSIEPMGKDHWYLYSKGQSECLDESQMLIVLNFRFDGYKWLENPNNFPGEMLERKTLTDEQACNLIFRIEQSEINNIETSLEVIYVQRIFTIKKWHKTLN